MNDLCDNCGKVKVWRANPGMLHYQECPSCTQPTVQLPHTKHDTGRVASVIEHYQDMPLQGEDGDTYYVTSMNAIVRWCDTAQDYQILPLDDFKPSIDEGNNRRQAIMDQRARKNGTRS